MEIPISDAVLSGDLNVPANAKGLVIFVHGSGSSRLSPRNQKVAAHLNQASFATLLFDLLTLEEEQDRNNVFDIDLLTKRLVEVTTWARSQKTMSNLAIGYFGASTGAAAAIAASTFVENEISAIVARGGRVDLAIEYLKFLRVPTLMIVGEEDFEVLDLNQLAQEQMKNDNLIEIVPGATHLFEEPGALDKVAELANTWFEKHLKR